jgi:CHAT domain-containing protein/tetratricopeptide (TPR) repeat protein
MVWLVIDARQQPDLLQKVREGGLHSLQCPACAKSIEMNAPFLVVREQAPRLLFSPSPGTTSFDDHNQLVHAIAMLAEAMGDDWNDQLFDEVAVVARALIGSEVSGNTLPDAHPMTALAKALDEADNGWKQQYLLSRYPKLWETESEVLRIGKSKQADDAATFTNLGVRESMLVGWRESRVSIASLIPSPYVYDPALPLNDILLATMQAFRSRARDAGIEGLRVAKDVIRKEENALLWCEIHANLAEACEKSDPSLSEQAYRLVAGADFACSPWLALSARCRAGLAKHVWNRRRTTADEDAAIGHYESAIAAFRSLGDNQHLIAIYDALGFAHYQRKERDPVKHLEAALSCFQAGARCIDDPNNNLANWAAMQFNIGNAFLELAIHDPSKNIDRAMTHLMQAAEAHKALGNEERRKEAIGRLQVANELKEIREPRLGDLNRAVTALHKRNWEDALAAYKAAIAKTEEMMAETFDEDRRREVFGDFATAYSASAYICFRLGRFNEGIALYEAGQSRVLSEEMEPFEVILSELPEPLREELDAAREDFRMLRTSKFVVRDSNSAAEEVVGKVQRDGFLALKGVIEKIKATAPQAFRTELNESGLVALAPEAGALILSVFSIVGCCVIVVPYGRRTLTHDDVLWLDDFTDNDLIELLITWSEAQASGDRAERIRGVSHVSDSLWRRYANEVLKRLQALGIARGSPIVMLSQGGLGSLPVHAAAQSGAKESFLDYYSISYAPSAYLLSIMQRREREIATAPDTFTGVADPLGDLPYGRVEGVYVSHLFPPESATVLSGKEANSINLRGAVAGRKYLHFSCHAYFTNAGGKYSGLHLSHDAASESFEATMAAFENRPALEEFFSAGRRWIVLSLNLKQCRLVILSACESGRTENAQPDEFLGLPAAFLRAGAAGVISTLWRVDDSATMLLMRRLYEGLLNERLSPPQALRRAQLWLRDATNQSLVKMYQMMRGEKDAPLFARQLDREMRRHALGAPNDRPFSNPYYWAAFVIFG